MTTKSVVNTETVDTYHDDGKTTAIVKTHREEETVSSGLLEAWMGLVLLLFSGLLTVSVYRIVSFQLTQLEQNHGIQQTKQH